MDKTYEPQAIENKWYAWWEQRGCFAPRGTGEPYAILIPPPNVTGTLHMGHAFQHTLQDALIRLHRMRGRDTLWQPGTDHAGIATQMVVERQLNAEGKTRHDLGREAFVAKVWDWKAYSGGTITRQMRRLGDSTDWSREAFTMDPMMSRAVLEVFERLHDEGLIYRGKRLVNWDPVFRTAISDLEVVSQEEDGFLWHLKYPLTDGSTHLVVATTRPETMLGDTAVAVHPEDERYRHLVGKTIRLPLAEREIPIVADEFVDREFGTGCVKITPAHDFNDNALGARHDLAVINILTYDARLNEAVPERFRGLDRFEARKRVVAEFESLGLLESVKPHKLQVPRGDRSNAVVEPYLTDQWYMKMAPLAAPALEAVRDGRIKFVPENWAKTYFQWLENIQDWCISRQLWWGHRIPAWYDEAGNIYVGRDEAHVRGKYGLAANFALRQDEDVLDTWFSSALWPFGIVDWPDQKDPRFTGFLEKFLPTNVLVTGFDIIFFWVARMIMLTLKFRDTAPFREVYITGLIRDEQGQKMSKAKGNIIDPIDLIDGIGLEELVKKRTAGLMQPKLADKIEQATRKQFPDGIKPSGTDALRFTLCALAGPSRDINFDSGRLEGYRNFCNKLWNASRFVLMNTEGQDCGQTGGALELSLADRWIRYRLALLLAELDEQYAAYRFDLVAKALYEFTWNEYCDWYLELAKPVLNDPAASEAAKRGARHTLAAVLEALLRALHPVMPFVTEEIWQRVKVVAGAAGETIMLQRWPAEAIPDGGDAIEQEMRWVMDFVLGIRRIRAEMDIAPGKPLPVLVQGADAATVARVERQRGFLAALARLERIEFLAAEAEAPAAAIALLGEAKLLVPMAGLIDKQAELARLARLIDKLAQDVQRTEAKLGNENFIRNAPAEVVGKDRARLAELKSQLEEFRAQHARVTAL